MPPGMSARGLPTAQFRVVLVGHGRLDNPPESRDRTPLQGALGAHRPAGFFTSSWPVLRGCMLRSDGAERWVMRFREVLVLGLLGLIIGRIIDGHLDVHDIFGKPSQRNR